MKIPFFLFSACCILLSGCTAKQPGASATDTACAVTRPAGAVPREVTDRDTVIYQIPACALVYTDTLPAACRGTEIGMYTARNTYWPDVKVIDVRVVNPTDVPLSFGREWSLHVWKNGKWALPETKIPDISWQSDGFQVDKAPLCYYFRFPVGRFYHLPAGKYRIGKAFYRGTEEIVLQAEFEIE
ncbi:MAG: hypothetical protein LIP00_06005 [Parabacteroides sp.]|nr:hypothetical protein [Parabacteroides sp.]